ncbi:DUF3526 domain-containing protein [Algoriphagus litoralis]|uniref:DUF3526 domain-containing protein n=1 Tax=Algoriphagus litoralis TaxID=2202829 RepID=UPI000DBA4737|nr:DUF3526 domain-containing protein [Algoriphagus litoralis]
MNLFNYLKWEWINFIRSPYKIIAVVLFLIAAGFSIYNGYALRNKQLDTISKVKAIYKKQLDEAKAYLKANKKGPEDSPWIDVQTPYWAMYSSAQHLTKAPSPMMVFAVGQAEQFGFYKRINAWSTAYDGDLAAEISNPERIALGALDFTFVVLFLLPILLIVLCFTVGGYEQDKQVSKLIKIQLGVQSPWIFGRIISIGIYVSGFLIALILISALFSGVIAEAGNSLFQFSAIILLYTWIWLLGIIGLIHLQMGQTAQAMTLTLIWVIFAMVIPGAVHQAASLIYPNNLMVEFLDAKREDTEDIYDTDFPIVRNRVIQNYPELKETKLATVPDSVFAQNLKSSIYRTEIAYHMKEVSEKIENSFGEKNSFITSSYWFNPIIGIQNYLFGLAETDYIAYQNYRKKIQSANLEICKTIILDEWNEVKVDLEKFTVYEKLLEK